ncbi:protein of unknown function [Shewanella benthica]|uniref:Uncharacterized protein n=1 Tax=Shewanella benthica TaxID=43661 RepID=A0A330M9W3_9GAMM|nr:protein of unknown function [Shewanella benthica]
MRKLNSSKKQNYKLASQISCLSAILAPIFSELILLSEQRTVAVNIHFHKSFWEAGA